MSTAHTTRKATEITFDRTSRPFLMLADGQVVGTVEDRRCHVVVGQGTKVHEGVQWVATLTAGFAEVNRFGNVAKVWQAGEEYAFRPWGASCGTIAAHKTNGYANGWQGTAQATTAPITCSKCLPAEAPAPAPVAAPVETPAAPASSCPRNHTAPAAKARCDAYIARNGHPKASHTR